MAQVLVGREALGESLALMRRAAFNLRSTDHELADALEGWAAETELTVYAPAPDRVPC
jgi:hypothetical protein